MKKLILAASVLAAMSGVVPYAYAQGTAQTVIRYKVDIATVAVGFRSSKIVGAAVTNNAGDKIGTVDDLIVTRADRVVYAVISVGGFLGMGDKLVAIPFADLQLSNDKIVLPDGTKETLQGLPKFAYAK